VSCLTKPVPSPRVRFVTKPTQRSERSMTPRDVPGPIVIQSLFPWLAALEPQAPTAPQPLRGAPAERAEPAERDGGALTEAA
jgi:hypothetical protein